MKLSHIKGIKKSMIKNKENIFKKEKAEFTINDKKYIVKKGNCITIEPGELDSQKNPFKKDVTWLYFGIATDN